MTSQSMTVNVEDGWTQLPSSCIGVTKDSKGVLQYSFSTTDGTSALGQDVPLLFDVAEIVYLKAIDATALITLFLE